MRANEPNDNKMNKYNTPKHLKTTIVLKSFAYQIKFKYSDLILYIIASVIIIALVQGMLWDANVVLM